ncbi:MAG: hypothetical protein NUV98_00870 [Candidatus Roizmanbacteria bacterium]|nr:hypothetical protein [Candidatus Roizmanbacteria bacterium]
MKNKSASRSIGIDSVILLALAVPFIMTYPLIVEKTSYVLFTSIFVSLLLYIVSDLLSFSEKTYRLVKIGLLCLVIVLILGSAFRAAVIRRHHVSPVYEVHDMPIQLELGLQYLLDGKNPYTEDYAGTALEEWHFDDAATNPAIYHFVMGPFYLIMSVPLYVISNRLFGYFDARMPLYLLYGSLMLMAGLLVTDLRKKLLFISLLAFSPAVLNYVLEGRTDVALHAFLFLGWFFLFKNNYVLGGISIALAFATKQSAWPLFPLYAVWLFSQTKVAEDMISRIRQTVVRLIPFAATFTAIMLPFYLWDPDSFMEDTIYYLSGTIPTSYPISGYGLGMLLSELGFITDRMAYYPFIIWQIVIVLPVLFFLIRYLVKRPTVKRMIVSYGILLFVYWYLSRYFNNSHLGYISLVFITAYFWPEEIEHGKID